MATIAEIRDRAAGDLGILRLNQTLQSQDSARITTAYTEVYTNLKKKGLATWTLAGAIPDEFAPYVVTLVANNCLSNYGVPDKRFQRIKLDFKDAEREIRGLIQDTFDSTEEASDF